MSSGFSVIAIIASYNEADIIHHVVNDLIRQGVQVYLLDDGSTDGTVSIVERYVGRGVVGIERLTSPDAGAQHRFEWERILLRKTELARALDADWFLHHDADEFRESPWPGVPLHEAIRRVDALGYNAIDFAGLDFWPVHNRFRPGEDVREVFTSYAEPAPYDHVQIRGWKKTGDLDLSSSGGHEACFPGRRVFPLRFILRHYPIRSQSHGERKVLRERQNRFSAEERARGWHLHTDQVGHGTSFIRNPSTLTPYDPDAFRLDLTLRHRGVEALEDSLADARCTADTRERELTQAREELTRTQAELVTRTDDAARLKEVVSTRTMELAGVRQELATRTAELALRGGELVTRSAELTARSAEAAGLRDTLDQRLDEIERWRTAVADQARQLDDFRRSRTWRWTTPARALYRLLGGS